MLKMNNTIQYDLIVIGGGASGMMCAGRAAELGASVLVLEKNKNLGEKLSITGGGRCNITNAEFDVRVFLDNFPKAKDFLYSPFSKFSSEDTFKFFEDLGLPLVIQANKRVFPHTEKASDVVKIFQKYMRNGKVIVKTDTLVKSFNKHTSQIVGVKTKDGQDYCAKYFAIATGGLSMPGTGSTGDGFAMLKKLGHNIVKPTPNIVPLTVKEKWMHNLGGIALSVMKIRFVQDTKKQLTKVGRILFTHFGVSGPLILNSAYEVVQLLNNGPVQAVIDMFPDTLENELDRKLYRLFEQNKNKHIKNTLSDIIPNKMVNTLLELTSINLDTPVHSVTKKQRKSLVNIMKNLTFSITGTLGYEKAIIADGGADPKEVNFKNMTSRLYPNLYLLGDILNINRPTGGYSLQLCWTTGWVAGSDVGYSNKND